MAFLYINTGTSANAGDGDSLRLAFQKINYNFEQVANGTTSTISITDESDNRLVDLKAYAGSFTLPANTVDAVTVLEIDTRIYKSAVIDISAEDETAESQDLGGGFLVTWNSSTSCVVGTGVVSLNKNSTIGSAHWNLKDTSIYGPMLRVQAYNVSGTSTNHTINFRAKATLFRL